MKFCLYVIQMNDLDFWLSGNDAKTENKQSETPSEEPVKVKVSHVPELSSEEEEIKVGSSNLVRFYIFNMMRGML